MEEQRNTPQPTTDDEPREAALIAALADIIERLCVVEQPATVVQSEPPKSAKAA